MEFPFWELPLPRTSALLLVSESLTYCRAFPLKLERILLRSSLLAHVYFDTDTFPAGDDIRSEVFRQLRGVSELEHSILNNLDRFPPEINRRSYFTYASCNITEGPFVFRKSIDTSYYNEIRKIESPKDLKKLKNNFYILDYYHDKIDSLDDLKHLLKKAETFKGFIK